MQESSEHIIRIIRSIAHGQLRSYSSIATEAGLPNGARQVARILHSCSRSHDLPWWRVLKADNSLALPPGAGFEEQKALLEAEGLEVSAKGKVSNPEARVCRLLSDLGIHYQRYGHPPVLTVDEANEYWTDIEGVRAKNLFLRNAKGNQHYLLVIEETKTVDLKALALQLGEAKLSFASPERLQKHLGLKPGAVSPLGLVNDSEKAVIVILDRELAASEYIPLHPNANTATLKIRYADFCTFLEHCGNTVIYI
ncbi:MAG: MGMT family protein [Spirochaetes bacterium]|nr:MGMT family protein [Spirochaetota bacterium]